MKFFLPIIFLLSISGSVLGKGIRKERSNNEDELSYQELRNLNVFCHPWDSCTEDRTDDPPVLEIEDKCSCHSQCWEYGTCCIDSPDRFKPPTHECVEAARHSYYMVHRCPDNTHPDSIWRSNCERELDETDILMISPVTSLNSSRTYKNYYCFRCHETTDNYVSWNLQVTRHSQETPKEASVDSVAYNQTEKTWVAIFDESHVSLPVSLSFVFPDELQEEPLTCDALFNVRADCPGSADEGLHAKCLAYSAIVYTKHSSYKNVHCALCNGEPLDELTCDDESSGGGSGGKSGLTDTVRRCAKCIGKGKECLEKDTRPKTCRGKYDVWNCPANKCKKINCPDSGKVRKNDMCVNP